MGKQNVTGYSFPRLPEKWTENERQFGVALRKLFDTIFFDQVKQDKSTESNAEKISEVNEALTNAIKNNANRIEDFIERLVDVEDELDGIFSMVYPLGAVVVSTSDSTAPFEIGAWSVEKDADDNTIDIGGGHYLWRRTS